MSGQNGLRRQIGIYVVLVFTFSSVFYFTALRADNLGAGSGMYVLGLMWCPALAAMTTLKANGRSLAELGWKWPEKKYALGSWLIPLCYAAIAYLIVWCAGLGGFPNHEFMDKLVVLMGLHASPAVSTVIYVLLVGTFGLAKSLASALGEEIGWRGFLVPQLFKSVGFTGTALISGSIWACWHYPLLILGHYNGGGGPPRDLLSWFSVLVGSVLVVFALM